jgi:ribose 5-phosphate isomerase B
VIIGIGADHAGYTLKSALIALLKAAGHVVVDYGTDAATSVDYADYAHAAARGIAAGVVQRAILVCGTGVGMAIAANRHAGVRAVNCSDLLTAKMSRAHNDANVLTLGARIVGLGLAEAIVTTWLLEPFEGGRHLGRIEKIELGSL